MASGCLGGMQGGWTEDKILYSQQLEILELFWKKEKEKPHTHKKKQKKKRERDILGSLPPPFLVVIECGLIERGNADGWV